MADGKIEARELTWRRLLPWTELFRGFQVAMDLNKLLLAAAGILVMSAGWWLLSIIFAANESRTPPSWPGRYGDTDAGWIEFRKDRLHWNLMNEAALIATRQDKDKVDAEAFDLTALADESAVDRIDQIVAAVEFLRPCRGRRQ